MKIWVISNDSKLLQYSINLAALNWKSLSIANAIHISKAIDHKFSLNIKLICQFEFQIYCFSISPGAKCLNFESFEGVYEFHNKRDSPLSGSRICGSGWSCNFHVTDKECPLVERRASPKVHLLGSWREECEIRVSRCTISHAESARMLEERPAIWTHQQRANRPFIYEASICK